ncbi:Uncharacterized conserved protein, DUF924 family [Cribrihabitans marinus]|jgi:uncharacterized protein (DUF924 family)|uniref:Uncharacterized conserved protein, DUF924 family n=1 Tax=Cribrihabitans marinus TaxID=1227549 RepID=A0A1H6VEM1_9RHOB|nr:DUF924 family protein [Cribrihabitans marinus]GGH25858.1 hypothetical protein GCM10010973_13270 [Cribrihabitans marinus]SEJ03099.1 Uncharacterized conserved protein, DUF924 family [Cribrihabitans marinus]
MVGPEDVLSFWLDEVGPAGWYKQDDALDATIRDRFQETWQEARDGGLSLWLTYPSGCLAYVILTDQFPRNMFRGEAKAFSTDRAALAVAKCAVDRRWDLRIDEPARQFFYMPMMHSENLCDQERCVRLMCERMPDSRDSSLLHARAHREVIRQFGRFPYRNPALERSHTALEAAYVDDGGYGRTVRELQAAG